MSDDLKSQTKNVMTNSQKLDTKLEFDPVLAAPRRCVYRFT